MIYKPEGELVVNNIFKVKEDLLNIFKEMKEKETLIINLANVEKVDVTFIQILYASSKYARDINVFMKIEYPSDEVLSSLIYGGFLNDIEDIDNLDLGFSLVKF
ncbi:STAS domain-containing protein [Borrelia miyamotoi]|uniref:STAS domain-containing protein n=1 Tax=Borrelia miyamotoi TaxID=47466 RepID=A0AAX3JLD3_9SPIR|nr:STAS domain-containing protein [Borrelia miyamotoi]QFP41788.1 STAS domain-containing protein [Borrelia miyamotoi]QFP47908.1 STAS domain-containing protein [Borrelia miyamotoi]QGT55668.1 STAS domain-containing protein [Borrelia miyamotoi]QGT56451.1 STAS domain-containing protein [Borrelia miyamotoi]WAZ71697.1 STAS domain-containing protein [Borrelia miyamotoi]